MPTVPAQSNESHTYLGQQSEKLRSLWGKYVSPVIDGTSSLLTVLGFFALAASAGVSFFFGQPMILLIGITAAVGTACFKHYRHKQAIAQEEKQVTIAQTVQDLQTQVTGLQRGLTLVLGLLNKTHAVLTAHNQTKKGARYKGEELDAMGTEIAELDDTVKTFKATRSFTL